MRLYETVVWDADDRLPLFRIMAVEKVELLLQSDSRLSWGHRGLIGRIPRSVLKNAYEAYMQHYRPSIDPNRRVVREIPKNLGIITWDQVIVPGRA